MNAMGSLMRQSARINSCRPGYGGRSFAAGIGARGLAQDGNHFIVESSCRPKRLSR